MKQLLLFLLVFSFLISCTESDTVIEPVTSVYFPPLSGNAWETASIDALNWNQSQVQPLLDYLEEKTRRDSSFFMTAKLQWNTILTAIPQPRHGIGPTQEKH